MGLGFTIQKSGVGNTTINNLPLSGSDPYTPIFRIGNNLTYTSFDNGRRVEINATDTNTQLSQENVQDFISGMFSGNTENGISVTYDDAGNEIDFSVVAGSANIVDNSLTANDLAANSVGSSELASSGVTTGTYGSTTQVPRLTIDADGRITAASLQTISSSTDGNGIYDADGTVNARTIFIGSSSLYFSGLNATDAEIRGTRLTESFFSNQLNVGTPSGTSTGWDAVGYRGSVSFLMNDGTTIVRGEGALYLAPPNQASAATGSVMTKQSDGSVTWGTPTGFSIGYQDVTNGFDPSVVGLDTNNEVHVSIQHSGGTTSYNTNGSSYRWSCNGGNNDIMYKGVTGSVLITDNSPSIAICKKYAAGSTTYFWQIFKSN